VSQARLATLVWIASLGLTGLSWLGIVAGNTMQPALAPYPNWLPVTAAVPIFGLLGVLITIRRPDERMGWIFIAFAFLAALQLGSGEYAILALDPGRATAAWISTQLQMMDVVLLLFLVLFFPTGHLPSPRWWPAPVVLGMGVALDWPRVGLTPGPLLAFLPDFHIANPFALHNPLAIRLLPSLAPALLIPGIIAAVAAPVVRFLRAEHVERQQIKLFVYVAVLGFLILTANRFAPDLFAGFAGELLWTIVTTSLPTAAGIAILRYRLYDIDLIIRRTLIYTVLTGLLALLYLGTVLALQQLVSPLTGQSQTPLVTVLSTLLIAALFTPLRHRVQRFIDRRFYRRKYDAARTLEAFSTTVRDEVELAKLVGALVGTVRETMQPASASIWLNERKAKDPRPADRQNS
jgi:hypothetical protein